MLEVLLASKPVTLIVAVLPAHKAVLLEEVERSVGKALPVPETGTFCAVELVVVMVILPPLYVVAVLGTNSTYIVVALTVPLVGVSEILPVV